MGLGKVSPFSSSFFPVCTPIIGVYLGRQTHCATDTVTVASLGDERRTTATASPLPAGISAACCTRGAAKPGCDRGSITVYDTIVSIHGNTRLSVKSNTNSVASAERWWWWRRRAVEGGERGRGPNRHQHI